MKLKGSLNGSLFSGLGCISECYVKKNKDMLSSFSFCLFSSKWFLLFGYFVGLKIQLLAIMLGFVEDFINEDCVDEGSFESGALVVDGTPSV